MGENIPCENYLTTVVNEGVSIDSEDTEPLRDIEETVCLEGDMELLELNDEANNTILLKLKTERIQSPVSSPRPSTTNRRYTLRPQKQTETTDCDKYKSTRVRKKNESLPKNGTLETIFENPILKNGSLTLLGKTRLKRYLSFNNFVSKAKTRHRKLKLKRLNKGKGKKPTGSAKFSIEDVKCKLKALEEGQDGDWMDVQE